MGQALFLASCSYYFTLYNAKYLIPFIQMMKLVLTLITSELDAQLYIGCQVSRETNFLFRFAFSHNTLVA